jgi:hypothetical protein
MICASGMWMINLKVVRYSRTYLVAHSYVQGLPTRELFKLVEHQGYIRTKIEATQKQFAQTNHTLAEMKMQIIKRVCPNTDTL